MEKQQSNQARIEAMGHMAKLARKIRNIQKSGHASPEKIARKMEELTKLTRLVDGKNS